MTVTSKRLSLSWVLMVAVAAARELAEAGKKYNILFLMCDSMDGRVLDPTSPISSYLDMPYLWSLAGQGSNFVRHYANNPQCAPSRSSMFTGRHSHETKAWSNQKSLVATPGSGHRNGTWELDKGCISEYDKELCEYFAKQQNVSDTFMDPLTAQGVKVMLFGKTDVGGNINQRPDQQAFFPSAGGYHGRDLQTVGRAADIRKSTKYGKRVDANTHVPTENVHPEDWKIISECMKWLEDNKHAPGQWMLYCSIHIPHPPYRCNPDTESNVSTAVPIPEWFTNPKKYPESQMHPYDSYMSFSKGMMAEQGNFTRELLETNMRCWYAMSQQTDGMLGQVWAKAADTGNLDNTIVIFTSDHGEMHMEHRQTLKNTMFEGSSRVPLIIAGPGSKPGLGTRRSFENGHVIKDLTSLLDMYPTFVAAAGGIPSSDLSGFSLMPYLTGANPKPQDHVVSMYMSNMANTNAFMIRKGPWKYIAYGQYGPSWYKSYASQLFNLDEDPTELHDVSKANNQTVKILDDLLRSVVDYDAVDKAVKMEERMLYDRYYMSKMNKAKLRKQWQHSYHGFSESDMSRVHEWYTATASAPQPGVSHATSDEHGGIIAVV